MRNYTLYDYWWILYRRKKTVYAIILFTVIFSVILSQILPDLYEARAVFFVPSKPDALTFFSAAGSAQVTRAPLIPDTRARVHKTYLGILESEAIRKRVHDAFPERSMRQLKRSTDFKTSDRFMVEVYVRDRDPALAAAIADRYVSLFNETLNSYSLEVTRANRATLNTLLIETQHKLDAARSALSDFQRGNKVALVKEESQHLTSLKSAFQKERDEATVKLEEVSRQLASVKDQFDKESSIYVESPIASAGSLVQILEKELSDLESQMAGARITMTESHPEMRRLRARYAQKKKDMVKELNRSLKSGVKTTNTLLETLRQEMVHLYVERELLQVRISGFEKQIDEIETEMEVLPGMQLQYDQLNWEVGQYQKLVENLHGGLEEATAQEQRAFRSIVVVDGPTPPAEPIFPNLMLNVLVAVGLGLAAGVFYAFFIDYLEQVKLRLEEEVKEVEKEYVFESMRS